MSNTAATINPILNGIDTSRVAELATKMSQDENYGKFRFRANNTWFGGTKSRTAIQTFFAGGEERNERRETLLVSSDQPNFLGGENTAPNPVEHYLNALNSCLTATIVPHASMQSFTIEEMNVVSEGRMDARGFFGVSEDVKRGYTHIEVNICVTGDIDEATVRHIASFSPVYEMVSNAVDVELHIVIN